jgi:rubredoxin
MAQHYAAWPRQCPDCKKGDGDLEFIAGGGQYPDAIQCPACGWSRDLVTSTKASANELKALRQRLGEEG